MNPLTVLAVCASTWIVVLGVNSPWVSASVVVGAWLMARSPRVLAATLALSLPVCASLLLVHGLFGFWGTAVVLGLRSAALIASLLAGFACFSTSDLAKAIQGARLSPKFAYVCGTALQTLPQGRRYAETYLEQYRHLGLKGRIKYVAFPLVTRMLVQGADRSMAAQTHGIELPGRRTVLRPVAVSRWDYLIGAGSLLVAFGLCIWA
ncbi:energy-coupling factor transporter transmembrane component T family protein [Corynebacterium epidermidicanis]|uniref:ABC-type cobalt transport system, permease component CbiQ n=1 Tax=Corynebacterium epidermidicanis TaxID=1050174 RepID=A0A0G3GM48_9CORY|nr:energy-coupling factor transporter transmembrane component T [Corynebacterium epidermidicanis]AKK02214.1 hypothetical protein CEPID_01645 [Corynebacterium epidermidicanis]